MHAPTRGIHRAAESPEQRVRGGSPGWLGKVSLKLSLDRKGKLDPAEQTREDQPWNDPEGRRVHKGTEGWSSRLCGRRVRRTTVERQVGTWS